jgi:hypothetical protein
MENTNANTLNYLAASPWWTCPRITVPEKKITLAPDWAPAVPKKAEKEEDVPF